MLLTARQIITCLVAASAVSGLDHRLPLHDEIELVHEPVLSPNFNIYDSPLEMVHGVSRKRSEDMSLQDKADIALAYLGDKHGIARDTVRITDAYTSEATGLTHIYARQTVGGIDLVNGVANINIDKRGRVISSSQSFVPVRSVRRALRSGHLTARMDQDASLKAAFKALNKRVGPRLQDEEHERIRVSKAASDGPVNTASGFIIEGIPHTASVDGKAAAEQSIMQRADGSLVHVWDITLEQDDHWWNARMNAATGEVESLHDWVLRYRNTDQLDGSIRENGDGDNESTSISAGDFQEGLQKRATYRAIPINRLDPTAGFVNIANPEDTSASPVGWLSDGVNTYTGTLGNNVVAFRGETDDTTRQTSPTNLSTIGIPLRRPQPAQTSTCLGRQCFMSSILCMMCFTGTDLQKGRSISKKTTSTKVACKMIKFLHVCKTANLHPKTLVALLHLPRDKHPGFKPFSTTQPTRLVMLPFR